MSGGVTLVVLLVVALCTVAAADEIVQVPLPSASRPEAVAVGPDGAIWFTLSGAWAIGRYQPATGNVTLHPLPERSPDPMAELFDLAFDSAGRAWTASDTHALRLDPATGRAEAFPLPSPTQLAGGVLFHDGVGLLVAEVTADRVAILDPTTGALLREAAFAGGPVGPLELAAGPDGTILGTATYGNAFFILAGDELELRAEGLLRGPVGLVAAAGSAWFAEMGSSSVARTDLQGLTVDRYPTSPSHYFPMSGPSGITVGSDGTVWFVEHFADRVAHLDPTRGVLEEIELPGAPGGNAQFLALADGHAWIPLTSRDRVVGVPLRAVADPPFTIDPGVVRVEPGGEALVTIRTTPAATGGNFVVGVPDENITFEGQPGGGLLLRAPEALAPGTYRVLVSYDTTATALGRYVTIEVAAPQAATPAPPYAVALLALALVAVACRRR